MPQIQWAKNSDQRRALPLSAQRLINFYAEAAPKDGKSPVGLLNTPGIKAFCNNVGTGPIRGMEVMDGVLYVVSGDELWAVRPGCDNTRLGSIGVGAGSSTSLIQGASAGASASFEITGGSSGTISSILVNGEELMARALDFDTDANTTAAALLGTTSTYEVVSSPPNSAHITNTNSSPSGSYASVAITVHTGASEGDLLIAQIGRTDGILDVLQDGTITPAETGWTPIVENVFSKTDTGVAACRTVGCVMSLYWRIAASDDAAKVYTFNYVTVNSPNAIGAILVVDAGRFHPTVPIADSVVSYISDCGQFNRSFDIAPPTALVEDSMNIVALAVGGKDMTTGSPFGVTWSKTLDSFMGPVTKSLHLQQLSQNSGLTAGAQWVTGDLSHADLTNPDEGGNLNQLSIVGVALSVSPNYNTTSPPLVIPGVGSNNYTATVSGPTVTITANNAGVGGGGGEKMVVTTTGDIQVECR